MEAISSLVAPWICGALLRAVAAAAAEADDEEDERAFDEHEDHAGDDEDHPVGRALIASAFGDSGGDRARARCRRPPPAAATRATRSTAGRGQGPGGARRGHSMEVAESRVQLPPGADRADRGLRQRRPPAGGRGLRPPGRRARLLALARPARGGSASGAGLALPRCRRHLPAERECRRRVRGGRKENRRIRVAYP